MGRLRGGHPFLRVEESAGRRGSAGPRGRASPLRYAESVPPAVPEGTAGRDGPRWLPSRVPTSAIDRIVKEEIRCRGGIEEVPPARRSPPTRSAGLNRPARQPTPAAVPTCFLSYAPAGRLVRRFLREPPPGRPARASRPGRVTPYLTTGSSSGSLRPTRFSRAPAAMSTRILRPVRELVRPGPLDFPPGGSVAGAARPGCQSGGDGRSGPPAARCQSGRIPAPSAGWGGSPRGIFDSILYELMPCDFPPAIGIWLANRDLAWGAAPGPAGHGQPGGLSPADQLHPFNGCP